MQMTTDERNTTKPQRPLEWMRFDPVEFGLLCDGLTFAQVGALTKVMLHLWQKGPLSDADIRRVAKGEADAICELLRQHGDGLSLDLVEEAREHGKRRVTQRVEAGKASAAKRNERSTTVEQPMNDRSADVLSMSMSLSKSFSKSQEGKERAKKTPEDRKAEFVEKCRLVCEENQDRLPKRLRAEFMAYWTEPSADGKMRFEGEKYFDHGRRMDTWRTRAQANPTPIAKPSNIKPWLQ